MEPGGLWSLRLWSPTGIGSPEGGPWSYAFVPMRMCSRALHEIVSIQCHFTLKRTFFEFLWQILT